MERLVSLMANQIVWLLRGELRIRNATGRLGFKL